MSHTRNSSTIAQIIIGIKFNLSLKKKMKCCYSNYFKFQTIFAKTVVLLLLLPNKLICAMSISPEVVSTFHYL